MVEGQVRRYFIGLVGFGFVAAWAASGPTAALAGVVACALIVLGPRLVARRPARRQRVARTRLLEHEQPEELPLVPDDPSLIIELS